MSNHLFASLGIASGAMLAGVGFGVVYLTALRRAVDLYCSSRSTFAPAALTLGRIAAAVLMFAVLATRGAVPLLAALLGFFAARTVILHPLSGAK